VPTVERASIELVPELHKDIRIDFAIRRLEATSDDGALEFALVPDPERYEWVEKDGERLLWDPVDRTYIPENVLAQMAEQIAGTPISFAPPLIDDASAYIASRREPIQEALRGDQGDMGTSDVSGEFLEELAGDRLNFAIISCDLVSSTALAGATDPDDYVRLINVLSTELGAIVPLFHGHVLKHTGDGLIAYIPGPSKNTQNDLAMDCALTMRGLVYGALNPALQAADMPTIDVRLGIDSGEAAVTVLGSVQTKRHADIIGEVISLACKVEAAGEPGTLQVGGVAARAMHTQWRQLLTEVDPPQGWSYTDEDGQPYPIYRAAPEPADRFQTPASRT
jgi:class 3 adenylate cyclase